MKLDRRGFIRTMGWSALSLTRWSAAASSSQRVGDNALHLRLLPVPLTAKFSDPVYNIWCGTMVRDSAGTCHLYYSRWLRSLGHQAWVTNSEIAHAVADNPLGPYRHRSVALPARGREFWDGLCTHNPTVLEVGGKFYLYYMGDTGDGIPVPSARRSGLNWTHRNNQRIGVAVADSPDGPWIRSDRPLIDVTPGFFDALCCSNPTVTRRPDGGYLMVYKGVGTQGKPPFGGPVLHVVATSDSPLGPFKKHPSPVFTKQGVMFVAEDPFIWRGSDRYWAVVKDNTGNFTHQGYSLALFQSVDGFDWQLAEHPLVTTPEVTWQGGVHQKLAALERPQIWLRDGKPAVLFCAAADRPDRDRSFNVAIPLSGA